MNRKELVNQIFNKKSFLCVGLDTDVRKLPELLREEDDAIFKFNKAIIDATAPYCVAYKPNLAFYESMGVSGMVAFEKTVAYLKDNYPTTSSSPMPSVAILAILLLCTRVHFLKSTT